MSQYRLPCAKDNCGGSAVVDASQAGLTVPCPDCGAPLEVPTIRGLSQLQRVASAEPETAPGGWGIPQAVMTVGAALMALFLVTGIYLLTVIPPPPGSEQYAPPEPLPADASFVEAYQAWLEVQSGLRAVEGFEIREYRRQMTARRYWGIACLVLAGLGGVVAGIGWGMRKNAPPPPARRPVEDPAGTSAR